MSDKQSLHFLLVPDSGAARRLRRILAAKSARIGVVVGVWQELVTLALDNLVLTPPEDRWQEVLHEVLAELTDAFWAESYINSPQETGAVIAHEYSQLLQETDPAAPFGALEDHDLPGRGGAHLRDLGRLHVGLSGALPQQLLVIRQLLESDMIEGLRDLCVYCSEDFPRLSVWQRTLLNRLNTTSSARPDKALQTALDSLNPPPGKGKKAAGSLGALQRHLFQLPKRKFKLDDSTQWLGVRDFYEEAEVAVGMVQSMLQQEKGIALSEIGLLVPNRVEYEGALRDAFAIAGLPLAGLADTSWRRDLGRELILNFLHARQKPSPVMAVAACLTSPVMPWSLEEGAVAAQSVIDGDWKISPWPGLTGDGEQVLKLLRDGDRKGASLARALRQLVKRLDSNLEADVERARVAVEQVCAMLEKNEPVDWPSVRRLVVPEHLANDIETPFSLEGVTVWREGREPWRPVRHLLVLGFAAGHYPGRSHASPVFTETDMTALATGTGLPIHTQREHLDVSRSVFRRQLDLVSGSATFLIPRRDPVGDAQSPSDALEFMLHLYGADEDTVLNLDISVDRVRARFVAENTAQDAVLPVVRPFSDLDLGVDLLSRRKDEEGHLKPESPSALEKLMVSPLAWLLQRLYAEPAMWGAEEAGVLLQGTLSHTVFETVFPEGAALPARGKLPARVKKALADAIKREAPFMQSSTWVVERRLLEAQLAKAAQAWHDTLKQLGAEVIGTEMWLQGDLGALPIHGQADALLALPGERLLVVDYKKSSASSRRKRMELGYDSQVELYRKMLQTGGPKDPEKQQLGERMQQSKSIGVVYYNMNDTTALSDTGIEESAKLPGWEVLDGDVSVAAIALIEERLAELRKGTVRLNRDTDDEFFDKKAGVTPYALDVTPLTGLFTLVEEEGGS